MNSENFKKLASQKSFFLLIKILVFLMGSYIIFHTLNVLTVNNIGLFSKIIAQVSSAFLKVSPYLVMFLKTATKYLLIPSIKFLLIPISAYILICVITPSWFWRKFLSLVIICIFLLSLNSLTFNGYSTSSINILDLSTINLSNFEILLKDVLSNTSKIFMYIAGIYLFLLWIFPQPVWTIFSGIILFLIGLIETLLPTQVIPFLGGIIELITLTALFTYLFIFLHTLASLVKLFTSSSLINKFHNYIDLLRLKMLKQSDGLKKT